MSSIEIIVTAFVAIVTFAGVVYCLAIEKSQHRYFVMLRDALPETCIGDGFYAKHNRLCFTYSYTLFITLVFVCFFLALGWKAAAGLAVLNGLVGVIKLPAMRRIYKLA